MSMEYIPNLHEKVAGTVVLVEATSNENLDLWCRWARAAKRCKHCANCTKCFSVNKNRLNWVQINPGYWEQIGKLDERPVCINIFWARIDGYLVGFWDATSQVVDYKMIEEWLEKKFPGVPTVDAMNFHNAIRAIEERKKNNE